MISDNTILDYLIYHSGKTSIYNCSKPYQLFSYHLISKLHKYVLYVRILELKHQSTNTELSLSSNVMRPENSGSISSFNNVSAVVLLVDPQTRFNFHISWTMQNEYPAGRKTIIELWIIVRVTPWQNLAYRLPTYYTTCCCKFPQIFNGIHLE